MTIEFRDPRSEIGRIGMLTVTGTIASSPYLGRSRGPRFPRRLFLFRELMQRAYTRELPKLRMLHGLRWSYVKPPASRAPILIFETIFTLPWDQYLRLLVRTMGVGIDRHAIDTVGYPGVGDSEVFVRYLFDHHHPAVDVYAANPYLTAADIEARHAQLASTCPEGAGTLRWIGMLVPMQPMIRSALRDITMSTGSASTALFGHPDVHFGRVVTVRHEGMDFVLLSLTYRDPEPDLSNVQWRSPHTPTASMAADRSLLIALINHERTGEHWRRFARAQSVRIDDHSIVDHLLASRYAIHPNHRLIWGIDAYQWRPADIASLATTTTGPSR
jgi:hypothetical protein